LQIYQELGEVAVATEDGTMGAKGYVTELFTEKDAIHANEAIEPIFINVGPKPMLTACLPFEKELTQESHIWASIEYHTSCGVGICGKCANTLGYLTCVDGPFLPIQEALRIPVCQHM
jgi:dihydroorotate dehydrogenase electron transfer subunit